MSVLSDENLREVFMNGYNFHGEPKLADALRAVADAVAEAAIAADRAARAEPVAVHQFRKAHCADWYDGLPDNEDGRGPYEERTLYTAPPAAPVVLEADDLICASLAASRAGLVPGTANWALFMQRKLSTSPAPSQEPKQ